MKKKMIPTLLAALFGLCSIILLAFTVALIVLVVRFDGSTNEKSIESVVQLITACVTFLTLIVSILKIITKYVFPANDEEYITRIVEIIQNNDLENKKENIRVRISNTESKDKAKENISFSEIDELE
jgi:H+/Cl- antiporter ClcA